jgi:hypothetical protein
LRKLDLRFNQIKALDEEFLANLHANESVICLDLRENKVYTDQIKKRIALDLIKNIDVAKKSRALISPSWLDKDVLCLTKKNLPLLTRGLNLVIEESDTESLGPVKGAD